MNIVINRDRFISLINENTMNEYEKNVVKCALELCTLEEIPEHGKHDEYVHPIFWKEEVVFNEFRCPDCGASLIDRHFGYLSTIRHGDTFVCKSCGRPVGIDRELHEKKSR